MSTFGDLSKYQSPEEWRERNGAGLFKTKSSLDWFIKTNRAELVNSGALIPRKGRAGSVVNMEVMGVTVETILTRTAPQMQLAE